MRGKLFQNNPVMMRKCELKDLPGMLEFYQLVIRETEDMPRYARWEYGKHPTKEMIENYVGQGMMYCLDAGEKIAAAVAVTPFQTSEYHGADWQITPEDDEVAVVHLLAVNPKCRKQGYAKAVMAEVIDLAKRSGMKAVRLDALACNIPAHRLYESLGFRKRDTRHWYAENTGWIDFDLFEYCLS